MSSSVIVVAYNSRSDLGPCLDSILAQLGANDELIVVDNGSTDGTAELVRDAYPRARLIQSANVGYAGGNNRGAAECRGDYVVFLNPDTICMPGALSALVAPLAQEGDIALTTACIVHMRRPELANTCGNTMHYTGLTYCRGAGQPVTDYAESVEVDAVSGAAFAIHRTVFEELGGFDERFFMYVEDSDLSLRARLAGYRCLYVSEAVVQHDYDPSYSPLKAFYLDRNRHLMLLKNLGRPMYLRMLPALLLAELATWSFLLLKGPRFWHVKPQVYRWLWQERATLAAARRDAKSGQRRRDHDLVTRMTHRFEFGQIAGRPLAYLAELTLHPAFWIARLPLTCGDL